MTHAPETVERLAAYCDDWCLRLMPAESAVMRQIAASLRCLAAQRDAELTRATRYARELVKVSDARVRMANLIQQLHRIAVESGSIAVRAYDSASEGCAPRKNPYPGNHTAETWAIVAAASYERAKDLPDD